MNDKSLISTIQEIVDKSEALTIVDVIAYLEPFLVKGSVSPVVDSLGKPLIPRLTNDARLLPTVQLGDVMAFIEVCQSLRRASSLLLSGVEGKLKQCLVSVFRQYAGSDYWHNNSVNFVRNSENYFKRFHDLVTSKAGFFGNAWEFSSAEVIWMLSFSDISRAFYWFGSPLLKAKIIISRQFCVNSPDVLSQGLRALSNLRNLDAHILPAHRESVDKSFSAKMGTVMLYPWISTKCNLGKYYGKLSFLVYITTNFSNIEFKSARNKIKSLLQQMPRMTVNYLGIPSGWLDEPLWANI